MPGMILTTEAKAAMIANLELELNARQEKLRAMCEAQCASLRSRLERRVNRIPATMRQMPLVNLLNAAGTTKPALSTAAPSKAVVLKAPAAKAADTKPTWTTPPGKSSPPYTTAAARKTRVAAAAAITAKALSAAASKQPATTKKTTSRKRGSDELSTDNKENKTDIAVPKKRIRAAPVLATSTRATRATSRAKPAPAQVLSPKDNAGNARAKPAAKATRPR